MTDPYVWQYGKYLVFNILLHFFRQNMLLYCLKDQAIDKYNGEKLPIVAVATFT